MSLTTFWSVVVHLRFKTQGFALLQIRTVSSVRLRGATFKLQRNSFTIASLAIQELTRDACQSLYLHLRKHATQTFAIRVFCQLKMVRFGCMLRKAVLLIFKTKVHAQVRVVQLVKVIDATTFSIHLIACLVWNVVMMDASRYPFQ
jgi:hypothetical protein